MRSRRCRDTCPPSVPRLIAKSPYMLQGSDMARLCTLDSSGAPLPPCCCCSPGDDALDDRHFDHLARALVSAGTRRSLMRGLVTLPVMGAVLARVAGQGDVEAKRRKRKRKKKRGQGGKPQPACSPCPSGERCVNGACVTECKPDCDDKACGASRWLAAERARPGPAISARPARPGSVWRLPMAPAAISGNPVRAGGNVRGGRMHGQDRGQLLSPANVCLTASCNLGQRHLRERAA